MRAPPTPLSTNMEWSAPLAGRAAPEGAATKRLGWALDRLGEAAGKYYEDGAFKVRYGWGIFFVGSSGSG
jgi:hypothetical protein